MAEKLSNRCFRNSSFSQAQKDIQKKKSLMFYKTTKNLRIAIIIYSLINLYALFTLSSVYAASCDIESPIRIDEIQLNDAGVSPKLRLYNRKLNTADVSMEFFDHTNSDGFPSKFGWQGIAPNGYSDVDTSFYTEDGFRGYVELHFTHHDCIEAEVLPDIMPEDLRIIEGTITDENGNLLANIPVTHYITKSDEWFAGKTTLTDESGHYQISDLYSGNIRLRFGPDMAGYEDQIQFYPDSSTLSDASDVSVSGDPLNTSFNATIRRMSRLSGKAVARSGGAPDDTTAHVYRRVAQRNGALPFDGASSQAWEVVSSAEADFYGNYVVWDLEPGAYRVGFSATDFYHNTFADNSATYVGHARDIEIASGQHVANVDTVFMGSGINIRPLGITDKLTVKKGGEVSVLVGSGISVLDNDEDANQNTPQEIREYLELDETVLTAILVAEPDHGTLTFNADGTFLYKHNGTNSLTDSFIYKATDGELESDSVEVFIQVFNTQLYIPFMTQ